MTDHQRDIAESLKRIAKAMDEMARDIRRSTGVAKESFKAFGEINDLDVSPVCDAKDCESTDLVQVTTPGGFHFCQEHRVYI